MRAKTCGIAVVRAMLADGQGAAAEDFFFAHCQGKVGDADCAMLIAGHYKAKKDAVALDAFVGKVCRCATIPIRKRLNP